MNNIFLLLLVALLNWSCGKKNSLYHTQYSENEISDTGSSSEDLDGDSLKEEMLFQQPYIEDLKEYITIDPYSYQPEDRMTMVSYALNQFYQDDYSHAITNWEIGQYTGLTSLSPLKESQMGLNLSLNRAGSTAFQTSGNALGVVNAPGKFPEILDVMPVELIFPVHPLQYVYSVGERPRPFQKNVKALKMSYDAYIPIGNDHSTNGIGYVGTDFTLRDTKSKTVFYIGTQLWDSREKPLDEDLIIDACNNCSGNVIVVGTLKQNSKYITLLHNSHTFQTHPWNKFEYFGYKITKIAFSDIIQEIDEQYPEKGISKNIADYEIIGFHIGTEVFLPTKNDKYSIAMALRNFKVSVEKIK